MKALGMAIGILMSLFGLYAFFIPMEPYLAIGWTLGILFLANGAKAFVPFIQEKKQEKQRKAELEQMSEKKRKKQLKKDSSKPKKKDGQRYALATLEIFIGLILFICGVKNLLTETIVIYLVGSCVMFYGLFQISTAMKAKEELAKAAEKNRYRTQSSESTQEKRPMKLLCNVASLAIGTLCICHPFITVFSLDTLLGLSIMLQGFDWFILAIDIKKIQK